MSNKTKLNLATKSSNKLRKRKTNSGPKLTGFGTMIFRIVMSLLTLSLLAVLGVGLLYGYRYMTSTDYFALKEIDVTGNSRLTNGDILKTAGVTLGLNSIQMNVGEVEAKLSNNPWIKSVTVRREFPGTLLIDIHERTPAFWIRQGSGLYFADGQGRDIAPMHPGEMASLPILEVADGIEDGQAVLTGLLRKIDAQQTPFTQEQAAWIKLTTAHEVEIYLDGHDNGNGLTLRLSMDQWELQLERVKIAWRDLMRRGEFKDAAIIAASGDKVWIKKRAA